MSLERMDVRRMLKANAKIIVKQNEEIHAVNQPGDMRPLNDYKDDVEQSAPVALNGEDIKSFVKTAMLATSEDRELVEEDLGRVLTALGVNSQGRMSNEKKKESFAKGIHALCEVHFGRYKESEQAHILGELLFDSRIFSKESSCNVSTRTAASVSSCVFNAVNLLRAIDSKAGSLNDTATHEYAAIEKDSSITRSKKGKSILRPRHHLTGARKVCNGLVDHLFSFVDQDGKALLSKDERNQMILFEPPCLF
jgi:hypothetical protein